MNSKTTPRRKWLARAARLVVLACASLISAGADAGERDLTVVELFTSQGCSSCPPADAYLGELAGRADVLALSFHVDYWDYIGWKDPFARSVYSERQHQYQNHFKLRYVYTPQMVIQGAYQTTGSNRPEVASWIEKSKALPRLDVALTRLSRDLAIRVAPAGSPGIKVEDASVWFVVFDDMHRTDVARGENKGRQIVNRNVVRRYDLVGMWNGAAFDARVADPTSGDPGGKGMAVLVQSLASGQILGAARLAPGG